MELHLLDGLNERQVLFRRAYHQDTPLTDRSPDALAPGLTEALRAMLAEVAKDIGDLEPVPLRRSPVP
jgi:hypothetical protein